MALKMTSPTKHHKTGTYRLRLTIAKELRPTALRLFGIRTELIANLEIKDPREAKRRQPDALAALQPPHAWETHPYRPTIPRASPCTSNVMFASI